jgi:hypothetical protein
MQRFYLTMLIQVGWNFRKGHPGAASQGQLPREENAAPHHVWDSTIQAFRLFTANLREIYVITLAVAELGSIATGQFVVRPAREAA